MKRYRVILLVVALMILVVVVALAVGGRSLAIVKEREGTIKTPLGLVDIVFLGKHSRDEAESSLNQGERFAGPAEAEWLLAELRTHPDQNWSFPGMTVIFWAFGQTAPDGRLTYPRLRTDYSCMLSNLPKELCDDAKTKEAQGRFPKQWVLEWVFQYDVSLSDERVAILR